MDSAQQSAPGARAARRSIGRAPLGEEWLFEPDRVLSGAAGGLWHDRYVYSDSGNVARTSLRLACDGRPCLDVGLSEHTLDRSETHSGHLPFFGFRTFEVDGLAGQHVTIRARTLYGGGAADLVMLDDADEAVIAYTLPNDDAEWDAVLDAEIPMDGTYLVKLSGDDGSRYELEVVQSCDTVDLVEAVSDHERYCGIYPGE